VASGDLRIELFVDDVERSVAFYEDVLGFMKQGGDAAYATLRRGDALIGIGTAAHLPPAHYFDRASFESRRGIGVEIVIEVDDVGALFEHVQQSGYQILTPLGQRPWGLRDFRVADPDGYYLRITSR
jgi:predicted enzyme related to lactoylglutathione lyase